MCHSWFKPLSIEGHLGYFQLLAITNKAVANTRNRFLCGCNFSFLRGNNCAAVARLHGRSVFRVFQKPWELPLFRGSGCFWFSCVRSAVLCVGGRCTQVCAPRGWRPHTPVPQPCVLEAPLHRPRRTASFRFPAPWCSVARRCHVLATSRGAWAALPLSFHPCSLPLRVLRRFLVFSVCTCARVLLCAVGRCRCLSEKEDSRSLSEPCRYSSCVINWGFQLIYFYRELCMITNSL